MTLVLALVVIVGLLITSAATAATYFGLWQVWKALPSDQRRKALICAPVVFGVGGALGVLLIVAPWGNQTALYVFSAICIFVLGSVLLALVGTGLEQLRRSRRHGE